MNQPVIGTEQLAGLMRSAQPPVVVDCRFSLSDPSYGRNAYLKDHIPGAHYAHLDTDLSDKSQSLQGRHPLPDATQFAGLMRRVGVNTNTVLVAYDDGDLSFASRLWWLARYFGHANVCVLNGGYAAWCSSGLGVDAQMPSNQSDPDAVHNFVARPQPHMKLDYSDLVNARRGIQLIDSRDAARFRGEIEPIDPVAGHIPGACNAPWKEALGGDGLIKSPEALQARWAGLMELGKAPVVYCGSGVTACVNLLSMEVAGIHNVRLFAGSWSGWLQNGGDVAIGD